MYETNEELESLQVLLDLSIEHAGTFLYQSFQMPSHSLSARQLIHFWRGSQTIALATVTKSSEPRVAPIGAVLFHRRFYVPTVLTAMRTKHIMERPMISFTCYQENDLAVIVHGNATIIPPDNPTFFDVGAFLQETSGQNIGEWDEGIFLQITPKTLYTFVRYPNLYPED